MMTFVIAQDRNRAIGKNGQVPWQAPEDLAFFKETTMGGAVIMGRTTWDGLPNKPLPGRLNIVVTRSAPRQEDDVIFTDVDGARAAADASGREIFVIGGAAVCRAFMPYADRMLITEVDLEIEDADTFFPAIDDREWRMASRRMLRSDPPACELVEYLRRR